jgi:hypothetical protein
MAHLTCGQELRKRLQELNEPSQPVQFPSVRHAFEIAMVLLPSVEAAGVKSGLVVQRGVSNDLRVHSRPNDVERGAVDTSGKSLR